MEKQTLPSIPKAIRNSHRPTLIMKTSIEVREEEDKERRNIGRYSFFPGRDESTR